MPRKPALEKFRKEVEALRTHPLLKDRVDGDLIRFEGLSRGAIAELLRTDVGKYFLTAAAGIIGREALKKAARGPDAGIVPAKERQAYVVETQLPSEAHFQGVADRAVAFRERDLDRRRGGKAEPLFKDRLRAEGIPLLMSPPQIKVPGLLITNRKPDGIYPDPKTGAPPEIYLEVKNIRRVSDDIQKRLYEIAEVSLEMKAIYGDLDLKGLEVGSTLEVLERPVPLRKRIRARIVQARPTVVALLLCSRDEAERYRDGGQTFIDHIFFQEEIEDCVQLLRELTRN